MFNHLTFVAATFRNKGVVAARVKGLPVWVVFHGDMFSTCREEELSDRVEMKLVAHDAVILPPIVEPIKRGAIVEADDDRNNGCQIQFQHSLLNVGDGVEVWKWVNWRNNVVIMRDWHELKNVRVISG